MSRTSPALRAFIVLIALSGSAAMPVSSATLDDARALLERGEYAQAGVLARSAIDTAPSAQGWFILAQSLAATGQRDAADHAFGEARSSASDDAPDIPVAHALFSQYHARHQEALAELESILNAYANRSDPLPSKTLHALARAAQTLAPQNPERFRTALRYYQAAINADPDNLAARVDMGELLLEKNNNTDALDTFRDALARDERYAPAMLGLARSQHFDNLSSALETARASLEIQPTLVAAHVFAAQLLMERQNHTDAQTHLDAALASNPRSLPALAMQAALYFLTDESAQLNAQMQALAEQAPFYADGWNLLSIFASRTRRYHEGADFALESLAVDQTHWPAMASLGLNRLRLGRMRLGKNTLDLAFRGDPFNVRVKNTLDLLDKMSRYAEIHAEHTVLIAEPTRAELIAPHLLPIAEAAYAYYASRYDYALPGKLRIEVFESHADFSVRTVGLTGLDILGASFGPVVLLDAPTSRGLIPYNWGAALWHEIAHSFHLAMSAHRAPRWFSEGLAVYEERLARPGWGGDVSPGFLRAYHAGRLRPASQLERAFLEPTFDQEIPYSSFLASLLVEQIDREFGAGMLVKLLNGFAHGDNTLQTLSAQLGMDADAFDSWLDAGIRSRYAEALAALFPEPDPADTPPNYEDLLTRGQAALEADDLDTAESLLREAQSLFPEHAGPGSSYPALAALYLKRGEQTLAIEQLANNIDIDADHLDAHLRLVELYLEADDTLRAEQTAERALLIQPFNANTHEQLADLYERRGERDLHLRERHAVVQLTPQDPVRARYKLADALHQSGDSEAARIELLQALEQAPLFEEGLELLLDIHAGSNGTVRNSHQEDP